MRKTLYALSLGLMLSWASAQTAEDALEAVKVSVQSLLDNLEEHKATFNSDPAKIEADLRKDVVPYFDTRVMGQYVLGKNWRKATPEQRDEFINVFESMLLRTYSRGLLNYTSAIVKYEQPNPVENNKVKIKASVTANGKTVQVMLSMHYRDGKWKVYDVSLDGLSIVTSYRSSVGSEVDQKGLDAVIDEMRSMNSKGQTSEG